MARFKLDIEFDYSFHLLAIVSALRDYRLAHFLNKMLTFDFSRKEDIEIKLPKRQRTAYFSIFEYLNKIDKLNFHLMGNKYGQDLMVPELRQIDFILKIQGDIMPEHLQEISEVLRAIPNIQTVFTVEPLSLKSRQNLLFDEF